MELPRQKIYLAYVQSYVADQLTGHVIEGTAENIHDEDMPIWQNIRYHDYVIESACSFDGYYSNIGPLNEPCLIFTDKNAAIKRLYEDINCFCKYYNRMHLYDVIRPRMFDDELYPTIQFEDAAGKVTEIDHEEIEKLFTEQELKFLF